ncbi:uncharacterized protein BDW43DRAFT_267090 [Aspergillus alliaceus]|uniref:uncharacterized protein n=1 Tax=Petromyces alliaceus TaxID=209559 RepID=UPI0012A5A036|nr:uncharacterized protein BDW43DRAFT_267090 [Aspergillus alliaceus]KAB8236497.1 hypothetical protein BDW43DRAFT_267090 [Aspergillus alliaceus]
MAETLCTVNGCNGVWIVTSFNAGVAIGGYAMWYLLNRQTGETRTAAEYECTIVGSDNETIY